MGYQLEYLCLACYVNNHEYETDGARICRQHMASHLPAFQSRNKTFGAHPFVHRYFAGTSTERFTHLEHGHDAIQASGSDQSATPLLPGALVESFEKHASLASCRCGFHNRHLDIMIEVENFNFSSTCDACKDRGSVWCPFGVTD